MVNLILKRDAVIAAMAVIWLISWPPRAGPSDVLSRERQATMISVPHAPG